MSCCVTPNRKYLQNVAITKKNVEENHKTSYNPNPKNLVIYSFLDRINPQAGKQDRLD